MAKPGADYSLISRQTDSGWLRRRAIEEFIRARNTDRLVAYIGSYASEHLGYSKWSEMWETFCAELHNFLKQRPSGAFDDPLREAVVLRLKDHLLGTNTSGESYDATTIADLLEIMYSIDSRGDQEAFQKFRNCFIGKEFDIRRHKAAADDKNIVETLYRDLKVRRFITTNYDAEIELQLMTLAGERAGPDVGKRFWDMVEPAIPPEESWAEFCSRQRHEALIRRDELRLSRYVGGRGMIVSDIAERDQYQRLIEFVLRQPAFHTHILHLHGRFDHPTSALVTRRDYRDRYVQDIPSRLPYSFATRQLFLGNPILFVGLGGKEQDVMRTLEEHLSNNPNRRDTATFLLWSTSNEVDDEVRRIWFYRQYGVHVLYDHDIATLTASETLGPAEREEKESAAAFQARKRELAALRMASSLGQLGSLADDAEHRQRWLGRKFRDATVKYRQRKDQEDSKLEHIRIWQLAKAKPVPEIRPAEPTNVRSIADKMAATGSVKLITAESGVGRGSFAAGLGAAILERYEGKSETTQEGLGFSGIYRLISVNGAFTTELDSVFSVFSAVYDQHSASMDGHSRFQALELLPQVIDASIRKAEEAALTGSPPEPDERKKADGVTIILNGAERFIAHDGVSLSNELDNLIRMVRVINADSPSFERIQDYAAQNRLPAPDYPVNLILIGTRRVERYIKRLDIPAEYWRLERQDDPASGGSTQLRLVEQPEPGTSDRPPDEYVLEGVGNYFSTVAELFSPKVLISFDRRATDTTLRRRHFFAQVLSPDNLAKAGIGNVALASQILRILAFLGQPSEREILRHVPQVIGACVEGGTDDAAAAARWVEICRTVEEMANLKLVLKIEHFDPSNPPSGEDSDRLALNKALVMELRERYGLPLQESRLSASFNLSLFAAQPFDNYIPDDEWHADLRKMVDWLLGASRDRIPPPFENLAEMEKDDFWTNLPDPPKDHDPRIAIRLVRYYGSARLARMAGPEVGYCMRAALSLLRGYYSVPALLTLDNRTLDPLMRDAPLSEYAQRLNWLLRVYNDVTNVRRIALAKRPELASVMGHDPFYADDLLWIQNELGVVRLTQGDLYEARLAFDQAIRINEQYVEFRDRQQNWCRVQLNCVFLDIEGGKIRTAEERLRDIESAINERVKRVNPSAGGVTDHYISPLEEIVEAYAFRDDVLDSAGADSRFPTDLILSTALVLGYRGICLHLRGFLTPATTAFEQCLAILHRLGEQRAYSFFQRHAAGVYNAMGKFDEADTALKLCAAAAGPTRHPDIDHQGRICAILYTLARNRDGDIGHKRIPQLMATRNYGRASDMYRLQLEAAQTLALAHFHNGDHDSALRHVSEALAIAARNGLSLRKISLRILLGRIVAARGDRAQALELVESAMQLATRIGYERAVEAAENLRISFESS